MSRRAYLCPYCAGGCARCGGRPRPRQGPGLLGPLLAVLAVAFPVLCWPALVWHGYSAGGDGRGWRWDISSTYACLAWQAFLLLAGSAAEAALRRRASAPP